jgi:CBS domain-containing protein
MNAESVMNPHPCVLTPKDTIKTAGGYIMSHRYRNLPVVDDDGVFLGAVGINCLLRLILPKAVLMEKGLDNVGFIHESLHDLHERLIEFENEPVSICMKKDIVKVSPDTPLVETLLLLFRYKTSIPVVENVSGKLVGMISYFDVGKKILEA